ncbi:myb/SANT-like domain, Harbinger transposase-derived nuclease domain protein [Artemisia annua]|uniref:Myb/SANT-like domain, Harbinger transposase-derived nuclease domain protein n=1 Tax=Artemisia annua TaxID=35608 RepID=A0A2U1NLK1_ARTAN|nr:myb/SANT-like domain, Harbinger transposase-derived nuclease domain protein [Artemisia annua]
MDIDEQVAIFVHIIAHNVKNQVMICRFYCSGETISRHFSRVWNANCLGALDGTYIKCLVPLEEKPRYRTRKGEIATNVLGGSAADGRVLRDALDRPHGLKVPRLCYYLVDAGYTNGEGFLAPYRGQRYHLNGWRDGHQPTTPKELYNMKHSSARNVIEKCFGILKARWGILRDNSYYPIDLKNRIIMACCLLHNFIRQEMPNDPFETENEQDEGTGDVGGGDEDNINYVGTSSEWTAYRNNLADNMTSQQRNYRGWTSVEDEKLIEALLTMKNTSGYKADNGFKPGYVTHLETLLKVSLPDSGLLAKPHIESRIKTMKKDWQVVYDMLNSTSGFGYDKEKNCVTNDSPGVWDSYIENHPNARKWINKKLPHYEELCAIFGKDRAHGKRARDAIEMEEEVNTEEQEQQSDNDVDEATEGSGNQRSNVTAQAEESPSVRSKKKKNVGHAKSLVESFNHAVVLFGENLKESSTQLSEATSGTVFWRILEQSFVKLEKCVCSP